MKVSNEEILEYARNSISNGVKISEYILRKKFNTGGPRAKRLMVRLNSGIPNVITNVVDNDYIKLDKSNQKLRDRNNRLAKTLRDTQRESYTVESIIEGINNNIPVLDIPLATTVISDDNHRIAIVQLSDLHFNEGVRSETVKDTNEYNWSVSAKRLQKYADRVKRYLDYRKIQRVIFTITGDVFNSSRRFDEIVDNQDSLSIALLIGCNLIKQFILDVTDGYRKSYVFSVFGNESRMRDDITSIQFEDSFDYLLHKIVQLQLSDCKFLQFIEPTLDHSCVIRNVLGANILLIHGHNRTTYEKELVKYAKHPDLSKRCVIDYMLWGHYHETEVKNGPRRSSSLVGNNAYSYHRLGLQGTAEQSLHILEKEVEGRVPILTTIPINLDYTGGYDGYNLGREELYRRGDYKITDFESL